MFVYKFSLEAGSKETLVGSSLRVGEPFSKLNVMAAYTSVLLATGLLILAADRNCISKL